MDNGAVTVADLEVVISYRTEGSPSKTLNETAQAVKKIKETSEKTTIATDKLFTSIKRIAFYRVIRAILKAIVSAIKEGISNLEAWSRLNDGKFAASMDTLRNSLTLLKDSLAVVLAPIIEDIIVPIIYVLARAIQFVCNAISLFIAFLKGESSYMRAVFADTNKANDAANKYKRTLLGFDELNVLKNDNSSGIADAFERVSFRDNGDDDKRKNLFVAQLPFVRDFSAAVDVALALVAKLKELLTEDSWKNHEINVSFFPEAAMAAITAFTEWVANTFSVFQIPDLKINVLIDEALAQIETFSAIVTEKIAAFGEELAAINATIAEWLVTTAKSFSEWALDIASKVSLAISSVAMSVFNGLTNAVTNIIAFVTSTSQAFVAWGENILENIANTMQGFVDAVASGLKTAWDNFKEFFEATGQKIGGWFSEHKTAIITTAALAAVAVGAIALAPATGGASLGAMAAFADGGVLTAPTVGLLGEYPNAQANPEIVSPQNIMAETFEAVLADNISPVLAAIDRVAQTIEDKDSNLYVDGTKLTRKVSNIQRSMSSQSNGSLVII